jgi:hypothetical protein
MAALSATSLTNITDNENIVHSIQVFSVYDSENNSSLIETETILEFLLDDYVHSTTVLTRNRTHRSKKTPHCFRPSRFLMT